MKKEYESIFLQVIFFKEDIITSSPTTAPSGDKDGLWQPGWDKPRWGI